MEEYFAPVVARIKEANAKGENVLVHCMQGVSRSVALVLAYLISDGVCPSLRSAIEFLQSKRSQNTPVHPNMGFFKQLCGLELQVTGSNSITSKEFYNIKDAPKIPERVLAMINQMTKHHGLQFPWNCPICTLINDLSPSACKACGSSNGTYNSEVAVAIIQASAAGPILGSTDTTSGSTTAAPKGHHELDITELRSELRPRKLREDGKHLLVVLHIIDDARAGVPAIVERTVQQATIAFDNGADGVFLIIGETGIPIEVVISCYRAVRRQYPQRFIGINFLAKSEVACAKVPDDADALWTDFGVDRKGPSPEAMKSRELLRAGGWGGQHFGGFFFKGFDQRLPEDEERLSQFAALAARQFDVLTTSGPGTGQPVEVEHLARLYTAACSVGSVAAMTEGRKEGETAATEGRMRSGVPLALASGVDEDNVHLFLPFVNYFLVGSGVEADAEDPHTRAVYEEAGLGRAVKVGNLDPCRVASLAAKIHAYDSGHL